MMVFAAYAVYCVVWTFDFSKQVQFKRQEHCKVEQAPSFAHFVKVGDVILASAPQEGAIFNVTDIPFTYKLAEIENWPGHTFKPNGMAVYGSDMLYVVNSEGAKVEVLKVQQTLSEVRLVHIETIEVVGDFQGLLHSIALSSESEVYITESQPSTSTPDSLIATLITALRLIFTRSSSLQHCVKEHTKFMCSPTLTGGQLQGLSYDGTYVYVADTVNKEVIRLKRKKDGSIRESNSVTVSFSPVQLQSFHGTILVVGYADFHEAFIHDPASSGIVSGVVAELKKERRDWIATEVYVENLGSGACSVYKTKKAVLVGHCFEPSVLVCSSAKGL